jgi:hypothetical protein
MIKVLGFSLAAFTLIGCGLPAQRQVTDRHKTPAERATHGTPDAPLPDAFFHDGTVINATGARMDGSVGPAVGLADDAQDFTFFDDGYYTQAETTVQSQSGSAMGIFSLQGSVRNIAPGDTVRTCMDEYGGITDGDTAIIASFTGCANSGNPGDGWAYDQPADCTDVGIDAPDEDAPDGTIATAHIMAHWPADAYGNSERTVKSTIHLTED